MATLSARVQAIADALINRTSTAAQQTRMADAFARNRQMDPATLNQAQKAQLLLDAFFEFGIGEMRRAESQQAAQTAASSAAAQVNTDFTPTP